MAQPTPWHIVYREIALQLYQINQEYEVRAGARLYGLVAKSSVYRKHNGWLANLGMRKPTIDPIQLFASFSRSRQPQNIRLEVINEVAGFLGMKNRWDQIDFEGCPTPVALKLQNIRPEPIQKRIWDTFDAIIKTGQTALTPAVWEDVKTWRGIQIPSFTIFLFWINSDEFLPLDKNTRQYLEQRKLLKSNANITHQEYKNLLSNHNIQPYTQLATEAYYFINQPGVFEQKFKTISQFPAPQSIPTNFKLIGLKTLNRNKNIHKILPPNEYYPFDHSISPEVTDKQGAKEPITFNFKNTETESLYNQEDLKIHLSAIVGKNGSGKSTLIDLLLMGIYNLAIELGYLNKTEHKPLSRLNFEIYWHSDTLYKLVWDKEIRLYAFQQKTNKDSTIVYELNKKTIPLIELKQSFFYSILVNYSHYALNSSDYTLDWITPLSHKNDGYKTPLVINPMRTEGNIYINKEKELLNMRLLLNLLELHDADIPQQSFRYVDNGKYLRYFSIHYNEKKQQLKEKEANARIYDDEKILKIVMEQIAEVFDLPTASDSTPNYHKDICYYVTNKLFTITTKYEPYKGKYQESLDHLIKYNIASMVDDMDAKFERRLATKLKELVEDIKKDPSHVTLKLKQAIHYLKYPALSKLVDESIKSKNIIELDGYNKMVNKIINHVHEEDLTAAALLPPPIFILDFYLDDADKSSFSKASSGEYQLMSVLSSIIYHIRNIDSIAGENRYNYITVLLDEIELYFHPNMQRFFIKKMLDALAKLETELYGMHILLATHSPFILSDIQQQHILKLKNGKVESNGNPYNTFAANIHDLLADEFFLEEGYMGAFAKKKIEQTINVLNYAIANNNLKKTEAKKNEFDKKEWIILKQEQEKNKLVFSKNLSNLGYWNEKQQPENFDINIVQRSIFELIEIIGEPLIKEKLKKMYQDVFPENHSNETERNLTKQAILKMMQDHNINPNELQ